MSGVGVILNLESLFGGINSLLLECTLEGFLQDSELKFSFSAESWRHLPALSGPAHIVCPLDWSVKDTMINHWG